MDNEPRDVTRKILALTYLESGHDGDVINTHMHGLMNLLLTSVVRMQECTMNIQIQHRAKPHNIIVNYKIYSKVIQSREPERR